MSGVLRTVAAVTALLGLWWIAALLVRSVVLPTPVAVFEVFFREIVGPLGGHFAVSAYRVTVSIVLSTILAAPLGLALGLSKRLDGFVAPLVYVLYPIPKVVLLPILLLFLGLGDASKIGLITLILFFQVLVVVRDAALTVRTELVQSVRSLGAKGLDLLRHVYLPACLPAVLTGLRVSAGTAIAALYLTETFATREGLGFYIMDSWTAFSYPRMYAAVVAMGVLGLLVYVGLDQLERRLCGWMRPGQA